ncbi:site-specific integrase [Actinomadura sp. PM05-2]|uniref:Site-specific integrase n=2 Tax=Actinomadura parmotrematis TaxID=2864039 RepID=A0ABS7G3G3_9ACTN|nr:site-specific integrase [Actinomadura parmotrematis]
MKRGKTWSYVIRVTDPETGLSKPKWVGGYASEDEAKAARDEARVKARRGEYIDRNAITVGEYLDQWIEAHEVEIKPRTLASYRTMIRLYVKPHIGGMRLQAVRPATVSKLYRDLRAHGGEGGKPLGIATVTRTHAILRKAFGDAVLVDEILPSNPVERAKRPRADHAEPGAVWSIEQLRTFLVAVRRHRLFAFYRLAAYTGARRGELLNLRWSNVDLDGLRITITGSTGVVAGQRVEGTTKSGRSRVVTIDAETAAVLKAHRKAQVAEKLLVGDEWKGAEDGYVFATTLGEPIHPDSVGWLMTKTIRAYNAPKDGPRPAEPLPHARVHDLRHIHATALLLARVPVHIVAARLGHADPAITLRVYAHVVRSAEVSAAETFAAVMEETG